MTGFLVYFPVAILIAGAMIAVLQKYEVEDPMIGILVGVVWPLIAAFVAFVAAGFALVYPIYRLTCLLIRTPTPLRVRDLRDIFLGRQPSKTEEAA